MVRHRAAHLVEDPVGGRLYERLVVSKEFPAQLSSGRVG
jgi:hypothetical protein